MTEQGPKRLMPSSEVGKRGAGNLASFPEWALRIKRGCQILEPLTDEMSKPDYRTFWLCRIEDEQGLGDCMFRNREMVHAFPAPSVDRRESRIPIRNGWRKDYLVRNGIHPCWVTIELFRKSYAAVRKHVQRWLFSYV